MTLSPIGSVYGRSGGDSTDTSWVVWSVNLISTVVRLAATIEFSEFLTVMLKLDRAELSKVTSVIDSCAGLGVVSVRWNR